MLIGRLFSLLKWSLFRLHSFIFGEGGGNVPAAPPQTTPRRRHSAAAGPKGLAAFMKKPLVRWTSLGAVVGDVWRFFGCLWLSLVQFLSAGCGDLYLYLIYYMYYFSRTSLWLLPLIFRIGEFPRWNDSSFRSFSQKRCLGGLKIQRKISGNPPWFWFWRSTGRC